MRIIASLSSRRRRPLLLLVTQSRFLEQTEPLTHCVVTHKVVDISLPILDDNHAPHSTFRSALLRCSTTEIHRERFLSICPAINCNFVAAAVMELKTTVNGIF
jgi:hypothetical protein